MQKAKKEEDDLCGLIAASLTPREMVDSALDEIRPAKSMPEGVTQHPIPTLEPGKHGHFVSFDGSTKPNRGGGSCGAVLWGFPGWEVVDAITDYFEDSTVNEAEYRGLISAVELATRHAIRNLILAGTPGLSFNR